MIAVGAQPQRPWHPNLATDRQVGQNRCPFDLLEFIEYHVTALNNARPYIVADALRLAIEQAHTKRVRDRR